MVTHQRSVGESKLAVCAPLISKRMLLTRLNTDPDVAGSCTCTTHIPGGASVSQCHGAVAVATFQHDCLRSHVEHTILKRVNATDL